jgi:hypothetical protein
MLTFFVTFSAEKAGMGLHFHEKRCMGVEL